jgi:hypothetical protein
VVIRCGEPYGSAYGAAESSNAPVLCSGAAGLLPGTDAEVVAKTMMEACEETFIIEMEKERAYPMPEDQQKTGIVDERVAFGEKVSKVGRRSGAGSHRSGTVTEYAQEDIDDSKVQQARNAVRPPRELNPDPEATEY